MATTRQPRRRKQTQQLTRARTTAPAERKPRRAVKILDPALKERLALKGSTVEERSAEASERIIKRVRGRPKTGKTTRSIHVSVPHDVADWLDEQPNASAVVTEALRAHIEKSSRR